MSAERDLYTKIVPGRNYSVAVMRYRMHIYLAQAPTPDQRARTDPIFKILDLYPDNTPVHFKANPDTKSLDVVVRFPDKFDTVKV